MKSLQEEIDVQKRILDNPNTPPALKSIIQKKIDSLELQAGVFTPSKKQPEIVDWFEANFPTETKNKARETGTREVSRTLLGSSPTLEGIKKVIKNYYIGSTINLIPSGTNVWEVTNLKGTIENVEVVQKVNRFRFEQINLTPDKKPQKIEIPKPKFKEGHLVLANYGEEFGNYGKIIRVMPYRDGYSYEIEGFSKDISEDNLEILSLPPSKFNIGDKVIHIMDLVNDVPFKEGTITDKVYRPVGNDMTWTYYIPEFGSVLVPENAIRLAPEVEKLSIDWNEKARQQLEENMNVASAELNFFLKGKTESNGLTPDLVKETAEFKKLNSTFKTAFKEYRDFNAKHKPQKPTGNAFERQKARRESQAVANKPKSAVKMLPERIKIEPTQTQVPLKPKRSPKVVVKTVNKVENKMEDELEHYKNILKNISHPSYKNYVKKNVEKVISELEDKIFGTQKPRRSPKIVSKKAPAPALKKKSSIEEKLKAFREDPEYSDILAGRTERGIAQDLETKAKPVGRRVSATGNVYYEYRANESDKNRRKKL